MTAKQSVLAAAGLSGSLILALILSYVFLRSQPIPAATLVMVMIWGALRLTRRLLGAPPVPFHTRGLLFGLGAGLGLMGAGFQEDWTPPFQELSSPGSRRVTGCF